MVVLQCEQRRGGEKADEGKTQGCGAGVVIVLLTDPFKRDPGMRLIHLNSKFIAYSLNLQGRCRAKKKRSFESLFLFEKKNSWQCLTNRLQRPVRKLTVKSWRIAFS